LEYASGVWSPYKKKYIEAIENVQKRATRMLPQMKNLNYEERLKQLKMPTLKFRRMRGDMIETFKILTRLYDGRVTEGMLDISRSHITRGNALKLVKHQSRRDIRKYSFTNRIVDLWNSLPNHIVEAKTMFQFENRLDRHWENHLIKYDFTAEYGPTTGRLGAVRNDEEELPIEPRQELQAEST
jgi:hypothetical protein